MLFVQSVVVPICWYYNTFPLDCAIVNTVCKWRVSLSTSIVSLLFMIIKHLFICSITFNLIASLYLKNSWVIFCSFLCFFLSYYSFIFFSLIGCWHRLSNLYMFCPWVKVQTVDKYSYIPYWLLSELTIL